MRSLIFAAAIAACSITPCSAGEPSALIPSFAEETKSSGIDSVYSGDWEYMVGGGAASFDCDDDGYPDLLLAGGEAKANFYRNASAKGGPLKFTKQASGLELDKVTGAYPLDIDSDAIMDLVLLRVGENTVMRGKGKCLFERANEAWGFDGGDGWSTSLAAIWERGAHWPTIAIGNYIDRKEELSPWGSCTDNWLHRPLTADGRQERRFAPPLPLKPSFCPLSMLFTDWNRSGTPSLRVSNDREYYEGGQEQLWHVDEGKAPALYTPDEGWKPLRIWGMGIASADLNADGYPEYFLTSMADNRLQTLKVIPESGKPAPDYGEVALAKGVTAQRPYTGGDLKPSTAWHTQFEDVNNDGLADLFIAKGNVAKMPDFAAKDPNNLLIQGGDGKFTEAGEMAGVSSFATSRGAALADFNLDGLIDLAVVNRWESAQVWRNTTKSAGGWVEVKLRQEGANRSAVGAWIELKRGDQMSRRDISVGGGHAGSSSGWTHFGLGDAAQTELRVIWPDGLASDWQTLQSGGFYILEQGKPALRWTPKR